jgi:predicted nucleic acid-binding Zn ribbon protein
MEEDQQQPTPLRVPSAQQVLADLQKEQQDNPPATPAPVQPVIQQTVAPRVEPANQVPTILPVMPKPAAQLMSQSGKERMRKEAQRTRQIVISILLSIVAVVVAIIVFGAVFSNITEDLNPSESSSTSRVDPTKL